METFDQGPEDAAKDITAPTQDERAQGEAARIAKARAIWTESGPIDDTPGRAYLSGREIDRVPDGVARWHEGGKSLKKDGGKSLNNDPALLFAATSEDGEIRAVQVLFFGPDGKPRIGRKGKKSRYTFGVHKDAALRLPGEGGLFATESCEDALSLWLATGRPVLAAFGDSMFGKLPVPDGAEVVLVCDNDDTHDNSLKSARKAADAFTKRGCRVSIAMPPDGVKKPTGDAVKDSNDLLVARGADAVRAMVAAAVPYTTTARDDRAGGGGETISDVEFAATIKKLAGMPLAQYERERAGEANRLGVRVSVLDKLVANERPRDESSPGQGSPLDFPSPEPWPDPVDGAELLNELRDTVREYVVCSDHKIIAVVLWIVATWFEPAAQVAPILNIRSPINRCGKTTLLDIVGKLSKRALMAASITPAALFRTIEICLPTLIIDEADSFFGANDELRGVVDSGHTRQAAFVIRTVGEDHEPRQFSTWSFKAVSGIGKRAVTIEDRSIAIDLERKLRTEQASRLRHAPRGLFTALQQKLCRWSGDNLDAAAASRPNIPGALDDRQQDNWEILIAVADLAGGDWPTAARNAAISLSNSKEDTETLGVQLLHDVKTIVASSKDNGAYSIALLEELVKMPERPWSEINRGKQITQNRLAKMLGAFGLKTKNLRIGDDVRREYDLADLRAAFERYCPETPTQATDSGETHTHPPDSGFESATALHDNNINDVGANQSATRGGLVAPPEM